MVFVIGFLNLAIFMALCMKNVQFLIIHHYTIKDIYIAYYITITEMNSYEKLRNEFNRNN